MRGDPPPLQTVLSGCDVVLPAGPRDRVRRVEGKLAAAGRVAACCVRHTLNRTSSHRGARRETAEAFVPSSSLPTISGDSDVHPCVMRMFVVPEHVVHVKGKEWKQDELAWCFH